MSGAQLIFFVLSGKQATGVNKFKVAYKDTHTRWTCLRLKQESVNQLLIITFKWKHSFKMF